MFVERFTGEMLDRPVLEDALAAAAAGQFEVLVVSAADRLSRNEANATFLKIYAERVLHIRLEIVEIEAAKEKKARQGKKKNQYDEADLLTETEERFGGFIAEIAKRMLVINMQKGKRRRVEMQGRLWPGAWPLYGYDWNNRETKDAYVLDTVSSVVVRRIFEEAAAGKSMLRIARDLNAEGILPPAEHAYGKGFQRAGHKRSQWWWASMLTRMIHTPAYWGEYVAFRREYTWVQKHDPFTGKNSYRQRVTFKASDDETAIAAPAACPAIVSKELAEAAQCALRHNKKSAGKGGYSTKLALLRGGFVKCGYCGAPMYCVTNTPNPPRYYCRSIRYHQDHGAPLCEGRSFSVQYDVLDNAAWNLLVEKLTSPNLLEETFHRYEQERSERSSRTQQKIAILQELVEKKERIRANLLRTLSEQEDDETRALLSRDLRRLAEEMKDTRRELEITEKLQKAGSETEQALKNFLTWCADTAEELKSASLEDKRQILYGLGVEVTLYKRDHDPHFTLAIRGTASQGAPLVFAGTAMNAKTPLVSSVL